MNQIQVMILAVFIQFLLCLLAYQYLSHRVDGKCQVKQLFKLNFDFHYMMVMVITFFLAAFVFIRCFLNEGDSFMRAMMNAGVMIWFSCVYSVFTTDKVVYLFGKVSPRLSLFLAIILRMVPRIKKEAKQINTAQCGIGRGANQGNVFQRLRNSIRILSMLITWTIDSLTLVSESMRSRGSSLRGRKAFSIYRFDNRDRAYVITLFACLTLTVMAILLGLTDMVYDPLIIWKPILETDILFCVGYAVLCLMPLILELWTDYRFSTTI